MARYLPSRLKALLAGGAFLVLAVMLSACTRPRTNEVAAVPIPPRDAGGIVSHLQALTSDANRQAVVDADLLANAIERFLASPDDKTRTEVQQAWLEAHRAFAATRALVIADHSDLFFRIDAWPIQPGFLDSLPAYPDSGIINDFTLSITRQTLEQQNGITDSEEISLGFHPLEYYAFVRPAQDFVVNDAKSSRGKVVSRRRHALSLIASILDDDIKQLATRMNRDLVAWVPGNTGNNVSDDALVRQIIDSSRRLAHHQFQEATLIADKDNGHGLFSQSSIATLAQEAETERQVYATSGELMKVLQGLDEKTAANLDTTLSRINAALVSGKISTQDRANLPLMFSAMIHQFDDLDRHLPMPR